MRRFATFWALAGSFFMLCLLAGTCEWSKESEKALRNQRSRSTRTTRLDTDHDAYDHAGDLLSGSHASNLSSQVNPQPHGAFPAAAKVSLLPDFEIGTPVVCFDSRAADCFRGNRLSGRAPPSFLL
ncbi:MAG: hypothetical protein JNK48_22160 [Bryobacterales bacterium]|nr:hypothetical protein [Bryobacterales bacterium]